MHKPVAVSRYQKYQHARGYNKNMTFEEYDVSSLLLPITDLNHVIIMI